MTRHTISTVIVAAASAAALAAFAASGAQERQTVTLTGCLRTGGSANVYLLRGAAAFEAQPPETPGGEASAARLEDFLLVAIPSGLDLAPHVNHRIAVSGTVSEAKDPPAPPAGANTAEKALKKISVQTVKEVASNCSFF